MTASLQAKRLTNIPMLIGKLQQWQLLPLMDKINQFHDSKLSALEHGAKLGSDLSKINHLSVFVDEQMKELDKRFTHDINQTLSGEIYQKRTSHYVNLQRFLWCNIA